MPDEATPQTFDALVLVKALLKFHFSERKRIRDKRRYRLGLKSKTGWRNPTRFQHLAPRHGLEPRT